jgi:hypothetical protein
MHAHLTHSEAPRTVAAVDPRQNDMHPGRGVIVMPAHDVIARRALLHLRQKRLQTGPM